MSRLDVHNAGALACAVAVSLLGPKLVSGGEQMRVEQVAPAAQPELSDVVVAADGTRSIRDASGMLAQLRPYARIASVSLVADNVLWELCEPERLVAVTARSKASPHFGYRHVQRAAIESAADLETILALHPDLLFVNRFGDPRYAAQLRARGITVFDLGEMHGLASLVPSIRVIGALIGAEARARELSARFTAQLAAVAADVPQAARPRGLYLSAYGKQLYAGGGGTSYHDVLSFAGLIDVAAPRYQGWPALDAEQVLSLDPDVLVTRRGMSAQLCAAPGLDRLRACQRGGRIAELDPDYADDPSLPMLDLAESLRRQVHGPRKPR